MARKRRLTRPLITCLGCGYTKTETVHKTHKKQFIGNCDCPQCGDSATKYLYVDERNLPE